MYFKTSRFNALRDLSKYIEMVMKRIEAIMGIMT